MMLDSPHTSMPMLMRGNAMVLKTPVENAPRTSIEKHLSWSSDIPPAARFPLHRSRPAEYQPNRQPATVCAESGAGEARRRVGRRRGRLTPDGYALHQKSKRLTSLSLPQPWTLKRIGKKRKMQEGNGMHRFWNSLPPYRRNRAGP